MGQTGRLSGARDRVTSRSAPDARKEKHSDTAAPHTQNNTKHSGVSSVVLTRRVVHTRQHNAKLPRVRGAAVSFFKWLRPATGAFVPSPSVLVVPLLLHPCHCLCPPALFFRVDVFLGERYITLACGRGSTWQSYPKKRTIFGYLTLRRSSTSTTSWFPLSSCVPLRRNRTERHLSDTPSRYSGRL